MKSPPQIEAEVARSTTPQHTNTAKLSPGGKCRCDKVNGVATAEPAIPPTAAPLTVFDCAARPKLPRWAALTATDPLPPPAPPPRA